MKGNRSRAIKPEVPDPNPMVRDNHKTIPKG